MFGARNFVLVISILFEAIIYFIYLVTYKNKTFRVKAF